MNKILFIITGSIASSRCKEIIYELNKKKFKVSCILTKEAKKYIEVSEIKKLLKNRIFTDENEKKNKMFHINLSRDNDIIIICPATANTIAKFANGYGNNLASNTLLAANKKILIVPAMNSFMWHNKVNQKNIKLLKDRGHEFIGPKIGNLKCGEFGLGRIDDSKTIVNTIIERLQSIKFLKGKKCLVTAGPTIEMIDPIRYISNKSSGKQGYEIASQLVLYGAKVILVSGPTNLDPPPNLKFIKIRSADEMYEKIKYISKIDIGIFTAAVSDFKNKNIRKSKIKKIKKLNINLDKNIDILEKIGKSKKQRPKYLVGFAAETGGINYAKKKLIDKNCDMIIYNKISNKNKVFDTDYNQISIITKNQIKKFKKMTKVNCAKEIIKYIHKVA
ncbi:bifunctional phosphopantothenoylcysteine decarboxylase/phosphopantothenate--cysteine ligase CoaBC [Pelagibacteraceae bacterium]|nr:bifunctional phosphopantothenoylcysteine decarboxylase/phosphopantothenate--cysteine ligase CoaBC [Pelagibacteraceae bacterium]